MGVIMEKINNQEDILELLAGNEETIGRLYTKYSQRFHEMEDLWNGLADDERNHAIWIRNLKEKTKNRESYVNPERFKPAAVKTFIAHTEKEIIEASKPGYQLINALSIAFFLEDSLIEKKYFEVISTDSADLKNLLQKLESATRKHALRIKEARDEYNRQYGR